jgi:hypothetical protein
VKVGARQIESANGVKGYYAIDVTRNFLGESDVREDSVT